VMRDTIGIEGRGCLGDSSPDIGIDELRGGLNGGGSH